MTANLTHLDMDVLGERLDYLVDLCCYLGRKTRATLWIEHVTEDINLAALSNQDGVDQDELAKSKQRFEYLGTKVRNYIGDRENVDWEEEIKY